MFREILPKFLRIILKNFNENFGRFWELLRRISRSTYFIKFWEIFRKILRSISENYDNHFKNFRKISRNTSEIFENYCRKFQKIIPKKNFEYLIFWIMSRIFSENFEKYFEKSQQLFQEILRKNKNTNKILKNNLITHCKNFIKLRKNLEEN